MSGVRLPTPIPPMGSDPLVGSVGLDPSLARYARNFYAGGLQGGRRRRGFRILRAISAASVRATDAIEFEFTTLTRRFYKYATALYEETGSAANSISTGWNGYEVTSFVPMLDTLAVYTTTKRVVLRETGAAIVVENFDLAVASTVGVAVASSATAGALVAGNTHIVYIVLLNANTGRQSGPIGPYTVTIAAGQTSYDINTLPAAPADAQYTHFKIYRTQANLTVPFLSQTVAIAAAGGLRNDGVADALLTFSDPLPVSAYGDYFVGIPPSVSNTRFLVSYKGMLLSFAYKGSMYHTEPGPGWNQRWSANYRVPFPIRSFDITAAAEGTNSLIVATGTEIFSLTGTGTYTGTPPIGDWQVTRLSSEFGALNRKCLLSIDGAVFGLGPGGAFIVDDGGVRPLKQVVRPDRIIDNDIYFGPDTTGSNLPCLGYDPRRRVLLASIALRGTVNDAQCPAMVLAEYPIDEYTHSSVSMRYLSGSPSPPRVGYHDVKVSSFLPGGGRRSFITGGTDNGRALLAMDCYGNHIELEYGDNDGQALTTAYTVATIAGGAPTTSVTITATVTPGVLPARGVRVVGLPLDYTLDPTVGTVLSNNGATQIVIADWGASAAVGTIFYIGGIMGWHESGAILLGRCDDKGFAERVVSSLNLYLHDLNFDEADNLNPTYYPNVYAQLKIDGGAWGPRVQILDGTAYAAPGKGAALTGKVVASGTTKSGTTVRFRLLAVTGDRPVRFFAYEPSVGDAGKPKAAGV